MQRAIDSENPSILQRIDRSVALDPIPDMNPHDALSWSTRKKIANLGFVTFLAFMASFNAAAIIPAFPDIAGAFSISIQKASFLTSIQIAMLGLAPLVWLPISQRYGRRPIFLLSSLIGCICNIALAISPNFAALMVFRALCAFFLSPAAALGGAVVTELFLGPQRATCMGIWTFGVVCGVPFAPIPTGFITQYLGFRWIFWILAMLQAFHFLAYSVLGSETISASYTNHQVSIVERQKLFGLVPIINPTPLHLADLYRPLSLLNVRQIHIVAQAHAILSITNVIVTVELPQLLTVDPNISPKQIGLHFIGIFIGTIIGLQAGGPLSDWWMKTQINSHSNQMRQPAYRLWLVYPLIICVVSGVVLFLVWSDKKHTGTLAITSVIGGAVAIGANLSTTTILFTYVVDCHPSDAAQIGVLVTLIRQFYSFLGPFWLPPLLAGIGLKSTAGVLASLFALGGMLPILILHVTENFITVR